MKTKKQKLAIKTRYGTYQAVFDPELDMGGYAVAVPGVQGAVSWGKNLTQAKKMAVEAIEGAIETRILIEAEQQGLAKLQKHRPLILA